MANHHIAENIASITSIVTAVATVTTGIIAAFVFRNQKVSSSPSITLYATWTTDVEGPIIAVKGSIINRADAPVATYSISVEAPSKARITTDFLNNTNDDTVPFEWDLQPNGTTPLGDVPRMLGGSRPDRAYIGLYIRPPSTWLSGEIRLRFALSKPGRTDKRVTMWRRIVIGPAPPRSPYSLGVIVPS